MPDLSVLIPARNEQFLARTVEDVLARARGDIEVIVVCDGAWPAPALDGPDADPRVTLVHVPVSIGQRAATNLAARVARGRLVMKLDAHCALSEGFDTALVAAADELGPGDTQVLRMYNLHAFDWVCAACGARFYQGPVPHEAAIDRYQVKDREQHERHRRECGGTTWVQDVVWQPRRSRQSDFYRFDLDLHFQYWGSAKQRPEAAGELPEIMCCIGAMFCLSREQYFRQGGLDEAHGSWGQMGVEMSCKAWLGGHRMVTNRRAWFAHLFRTQPGFRFPYPNPESQIANARAHSKALWLGNAWPGQVRPLAWLLEHFRPVPDWHEPHGAALLEQVMRAGVEWERGVAS